MCFVLISNASILFYSLGYWFELLSSPVTVGSTNVCPMFSPLGEFVNNTVRGVMDVGFRIYPQWTPLVDPCNHQSGNAPQYMYNTVSFHNGRGSNKLFFFSSFL